MWPSDVLSSLRCFIHLKCFCRPKMFLSGSNMKLDCWPSPPSAFFFQFAHQLCPFFYSRCKSISKNRTTVSFDLTLLREGCFKCFFLPVLKTCVRFPIPALVGQHLTGFPLFSLSKGDQQQSLRLSSLSLSPVLLWLYSNLLIIFITSSSLSFCLHVNVSLV